MDCGRKGPLVVDPIKKRVDVERKGGDDRLDGELKPSQGVPDLKLGISIHRGSSTDAWV
jgi:predicted small lipoprotein YifL